MTTSRTIAPAVYCAEQRFAELVAFATRELTVAQLADANGCAPSTLYLRKERVIQALAPKRPGPKPGERDLRRRAESAEQRAAALQQQLDHERAAAQRASTLSNRARLELLLTCHIHGTPLGGASAAENARWNASRRDEGPRQHESPWQTLGLIAKEDHRGWVDILLDSVPDP